MDYLKDPLNVVDIEGFRVKQLNGDDSIWLMLDGVRRGIPGMDTFFDLFGHTGTVELGDATQFKDGGELGPNPVLIVANNGDPNVYLVTDGHKRHVLNPDVMKKYGFDQGTVHRQENGAVAAIPVGATIPKH
jgi:hypothetical protein